MAVLSLSVISWSPNLASSVNLLSVHQLLLWVSVLYSTGSSTDPTCRRPSVWVWPVNHDPLSPSNQFYTHLPMKATMCHLVYKDIVGQRIKDNVKLHPVLSPHPQIHSFCHRRHSGCSDILGKPMLTFHSNFLCYVPRNIECIPRGLASWFFQRPKSILMLCGFPNFPSITGDLPQSPPPF